MEIEMKSVSVSPPFWYWIIAILAVLWNGFAVYDFVQSVTLNAAYLEPYGADMITFLQNMPLWAKIAWGVAVCSALLASLLLVLRRWQAYPLYILSFIAMVIAFAYMMTAPDQPEVEGSNLAAAVVIIIGIFEIWFSRLAEKIGWTRRVRVHMHS